MSIHEDVFPVWELVHALLIRGQRYSWRCAVCEAAFVAVARERGDRTLRCPPCLHCHSPITCVDEHSAASTDTENSTNA